MDHLLDAIGMLGSISSHILTILAVLGIVLGMGRIKAFQKQLDEVVKTVILIGEATLDDKGRPLMDYKSIDGLKQAVIDVKHTIDEHSTKTLRHFDDVARVADEDKFKNCDVQKCIQISNLNHSFDRVLDRFDQFDKRAADSRNQTNLSLQSIQQGQKDLGVELGNLAKTIISVLTDLIKERSR
jgi:hypothetical protein